MNKSEKDKIKEWVEYTGSESAPAGFTKKVMSQIEKENTFLYINPIKKSFIYTVILVFIGLSLLTFTLPSVSEYPWFQDILKHISGFLTDFKVSISIPGLPVILSYLVYFSGGLSVFIVFDRLLANHFSTVNRQSS